MTGRLWLPRLIAPSVTGMAAVLYVLASAAALAQSVGPDEAVNARGNPPRQIRFTDAQKAVIYNAVLRQRVHSAATIPVTVGAAVSPVVELAYLPRQATPTDLAATDLKYAVVEDDVVVVDPVRMNVVAVIHGPHP
jgi:hypothetical protein